MTNQNMGETTKPDPSQYGEKHAEHTVSQHEHGVNCGHQAVTHDDHVDFVHDEHKHYRHDDHYDEH